MSHTDDLITERQRSFALEVQLRLEREGYTPEQAAKLAQARAAGHVRSGDTAAPSAEELDGIALAIVFDDATPIDNAGRSGAYDPVAAGKKMAAEQRQRQNEGGNRDGLAFR